MPIASGAAGRVDVGVDTSMTWTPDGPKKRTQPANRNCDSYLQRYQELKQRKENKKDLSQDIQDSTERIDENDGAGERNPTNDDISEAHTSGELPSGERSKKSKLCVIL